MKKKLLSIVITLCMVFTMFTSLGGTASAEDGLTCTYTDLNGEVYEITGDDILAAAGEEQTFTIDKGPGVDPEEKTAQFALFTDVLDHVGAAEAPCGYDVNGQIEYQSSLELYLYITPEHTIRTAVNGGQGKMWWSGVTAIKAIAHDFSSEHKCTREYTIKWKPEQEKVICGEEELFCTYTDASGAMYDLTEDDILAAAGEEQTFTIDKGPGVDPEEKTAQFALFTDVLDHVGASEAPCGYDVNGQIEYQSSLELYLYITPEHTIRTAVNGGQGKMWWSGVTAIKAIDHKLDDNYECTHEYTVKWKPSTETVKCSYKAEIPTSRIYRLYNPKTKEHLFTPAKKEYDTLPKYGWKQEGAAWYAPKSGSGVYRLYNPKTKDHHYTASANEAKVLTTKYGWTYDNNKKPLFYSGGKVNIYRLYNKAFKVGSHHFTGSKKEYDTLPQYGWKQEGAAFKCVKLK